MTIPINALQYNVPNTPSSGGLIAVQLNGPASRAGKIRQGQKVQVAVTKTNAGQPTADQILMNFTPYSGTVVSVDGNWISLAPAPQVWEGTTGSFGVWVSGTLGVTAEY